MKITGLDLSLRKAGVAHVHTEREPWATTCRITPPAKLEGEARLDFLLREIDLHTRGSGLVLIEGLAYSQSTNKASELAGLHWLVRYGLWRRKQLFAVVITQHLKIYATGQGTRVDKDDVLAAVIKRYPDVEVAGNDGADALTLAAAGAHYLGQPLRLVPQTHERALGMINWPPLVADMKGMLSGAEAAEAAG